MELYPPGMLGEELLSPGASANFWTGNESPSILVNNAMSCALRTIPETPTRAGLRTLTLVLCLALTRVEPPARAADAVQLYSPCQQCSAAVPPASGELPTAELGLAGALSREPPPTPQPKPLSVCDAVDGPESLECEEMSELRPEPTAAPSINCLVSIPEEYDYLARASLEGESLVSDDRGTKKLLTIHPILQKKLTDILRNQAVAYGAVAAVEPSTGRVLALAEHSRDRPGLRGLCVRAVYPAASIFKIVTGAALLESGIPKEERTCYHGGKRRLNEKLLVDDSRRDGRCLDLGMAIAKSGNVVFAKLASKYLDSPTLREITERLGFNSSLGFSTPIDVSVARIPDTDFGLALAAAGFGEVTLSPLHGALLAAAVGNRGLWTSPVLFEGDTPKTHRVLDEFVADTLSTMLETTVTEGTARRAFHERGRYVLGSIRAAGKTGSLSEYKPFRDFSWFVGYAPKDNPQIAVAAVVVNGTIWRIRAPWLGREALRIYLEAQRAQAVPSPEQRQAMKR